MKLTNTHILKFVKLLVVFLLIIQSSVISLRLKEPSPPVTPASTKSAYFETAGDAKSFKFLFMYKYPMVANDPAHKLNLFTYKNVLFSNDQLVYFESTNESEPVNIIIFF